MYTNYYEDDMQYTPQSHDELEVDYEAIPPKWRIIISIILLLLIVGIVIFGIYA
jgi:hypothetical protein